MYDLILLIRAHNACINIMFGHGFGAGSKTIIAIIIIINLLDSFDDYKGSQAVPITSCDCVPGFRRSFRSVYCSQQNITLPGIWDVNAPVVGAALTILVEINRQNIMGNFEQLERTWHTLRFFSDARHPKPWVPKPRNNPLLL